MRRFGSLAIFKKPGNSSSNFQLSATEIEFEIGNSSLFCIECCLESKLLVNQIGSTTFSLMPHSRRNASYRGSSRFNFLMLPAALVHLAFMPIHLFLQLGKNLYRPHRGRRR